jgi:hypothetical protein
MEWLNPLATVAAGGLVAWSIRKTLCDGRTLKVKEYEAVLGSSDEELKKTMKQLVQEVRELRKVQNNRAQSSDKRI